MRTTNPALQEDAFRQSAQSGPQVAVQTMARTGGPIGSLDVMTVGGTVNCALVMWLLLTVTAAWVWHLFFTGHSAMATPIMLGGGIGGFVLALVTIFKKEWAPITAPIYAAFEGALLGAVSAVYEAQFPGLVMQAVGLTFATFGAMLLAFKAKLITVSDKFRMGLVAATGGIALMYLISIVLGFFGVQLSFLHDSSPLSIGISVVIVIVAALNLALDFDLIETGAAYGAPKYMEWYGAFGLTVTMVWLYLEMIRLLSKLRSRD